VASLRKAAKNGGGWSDCGTGEPFELALLLYAGGGGSIAFSSTTTMADSIKELLFIKPVIFILNF
jgi:hypothetical protein